MSDVPVNPDGQPWQEVLADLVAVAQERGEHPGVIMAELLSTAFNVMLGARAAEGGYETAECLAVDKPVELVRSFCEFARKTALVDVEEAASEHRHPPRGGDA